jgi:hypothetical protein
MQILGVFSIADVLANLFPGMLGLFGIYLLLLPTHFGKLLQLPQDPGASLAFFIMSYIMGVLIHSVSDLIFRESPKSTRRKLNKGFVQIHDEQIRNEVILAFNELFLSKPGEASNKKRPNPETMEWNESHYYVCRSLVTELMPKAAANGLREGAYRQLRMNLIGAVVILGFAGVHWGQTLLRDPNVIVLSTGQSVPVGNTGAWILLVFSISFSIFFVVVLKRLMDRHEQREVREILTTFLAGYKTGIFHKQTK